MNYDVIENSKADLRLNRRKALELLPVLRKRDEGGKLVRIDPRTVVIKKAETMKIKVFEAFAGYGSQMMALRRVARRHAGGADFQLVGWSEIDNDAIAAHNAVFPEYAECNHGDISKIDWERVSDFDLFTYSFPCQDISNAGLQRGLQEGSGSRSSLLWECRKAIETKRPSFLLLENVAALASKKFMPDFQRWIDYLDEQGYKTYWKKINAKDFGVPQNRVRVFALSIRKDASAKFPHLFPSGIKYDFPQPFPLDRRLRDILVTYHDGETVEERYYLKTDVILGRLKWNAETTTNHKFEYTEGGAMDRHIQPMRQRHSRNHQGEGECQLYVFCKR